ncbi:outer dense fiber protein 3 [Caerostris extrusa]|uniref:Outer dense fiber protein 3 n=1 Tax=Caerostris extrusa TaxID=172846 RepID=A0AAV4XR39_CAEEX|nr:outer dense fiber protein 3 [Caerostris extrusa]
MKKTPSKMKEQRRTEWTKKKENVENQAEMNADAKSEKEENADSQREMDEHIKAINEDFKSRKSDLEGDLTKKEKAGHTKTIDEDKRSRKDDLKKPGNRNYLSYHIYQGEWRPTRALRAVGAAHVGPGPTAVSLPPTIGDHDHDPRRMKAPAYVIGLKDSHVYYPCAPGSEKYDTRLMTNKGRDECHAPKIGEKLAGLSTFMPPGPLCIPQGRKRWCCLQERPCCPGPEAYQLPSSNTVKQKPPSYSMGIRPMSETIGPASPGPASNELHLVRELFH